MVYKKQMGLIISYVQERRGVDNEKVTWKKLKRQTEQHENTMILMILKNSSMIR